ncbi:glutathione reductase [Secundilactobacillus oryzae JCM 18671]|uniref:Glutathione reductase n=1 Tax=Secundilactobacillus oryzae JCM 18671 TaxID=1291743 RepID=A0A081BJ63_9LACO|nr:glutathione-disulfide reductase [Secundilactobacillus oryzae]GAK48081.1 glutathione reductase [Secundilactobacillus oryzae JCM 18671]
METESFDYIVIGGGSAGISSANRAAERGAKVVLFEPNEIGGTCVNVGCIPKKAMWQAASMLIESKLSSAYGLSLTSDPIDFGHFVTERTAYIDRIHGSYFSGLDGNGVTHLKQAARFVDNHTVEAGGVRYTTDHILIATGGKPKRPDIEGGELGITSDGFFDLATLPKRIVIVGSGYIATEFAGTLQTLGSEVTLLLREDRLLPRFDDMLSDEITSRYRDTINVITGEEAVKATQKADQFVIETQTGRLIQTDQILWAIGRTPNTASIGLEHTDVALKASGAIKVDKFQNTTAKGIYAVGDIVDIKNLTPAAIAAGRRLSERLFNHRDDDYLDYSEVATVIFTHPEIGSVGLTEEEAVAKFGHDQISVYESSFFPEKYALAGSGRKNHFKIVCAGETEKVVGMHGIGDEMSEILQGFAVAFHMGATKRDLDRTVALHPTNAEEFVTMKKSRPAKFS